MEISNLDLNKEVLFLFSDGLVGNYQDDDFKKSLTERYDFQEILELLKASLKKNIILKGGEGYGE